MINDILVQLRLMQYLLPAYTEKILFFFICSIWQPKAQGINKWRAFPVALHSLLTLNVTSEMFSQHPRQILRYYSLIRVRT